MAARIFGLLVILALFILVRPALAQPASQAGSAATTSQSSQATPWNIEGDKIDSTNYRAPQNANYTIMNLEHSFGCEIAGTSIFLGQGCLQYNKDGALTMYQHTPSGGAMGAVSGVMMAMYANSPVSISKYVADVGTSFGLIKPAYAQSVSGAGEGVIRPIRLLWQFFRNFAYLAFIVVFIVVGLMIMFRQRINPQTVISIQTALPGLVVGLILVTFSYFISALIIDTSFIGVKLLSQVFVDQIREGVNQAAGTDFAANIGTDRLLNTDNANVLNLYTPYLVGYGQSSLQSGFEQLFQPFSGVFLPLLGPLVLIPAVGDLLAKGLGFLATGIVSVILLMALLIQMMRLLWQLINSYIAILIGTVTSPLVILMSSLPGRGGALSTWWRTLLANALVFPAVYAVFLIASLIFSYSDDSFRQTLPLFGGINPSILKAILAYGLILGAPGIPGMVKEALKAPDIKGIPQAAIAGIGAGFGVGRKGVEAAAEKPRARAGAFYEAEARNKVGAGPVATGYEWWMPIARRLGGGR